MQCAPTPQEAKGRGMRVGDDVPQMTCASRWGWPDRELPLGHSTLWTDQVSRRVCRVHTGIYEISKMMVSGWTRLDISP